LPEHEGAALERKRVSAKPDQLRQLLARVEHALLHRRLVKANNLRDSLIGLPR
jgi:hypothetical protein